MCKIRKNIQETNRDSGKDRKREFVEGYGGCREMKANGLDLVRDFVMNEREREGEI